MANADKKILPDLAAFEALQKKAAELEKALEAEKAKAADVFSLKISDKGCVVIHLGGRYPVSLYGGKLNVLLDNIDKVRAFVEENKGKIKRVGSDA